MAGGQSAESAELFSLVNRLMEQGVPSEAAKLLRPYLDAHPDDHMALHLYGSAAYRDGKYSVAEKVFRHLAGQPDATAVSHYSLGIALEMLGRISEAVSSFKIAVALDFNYVPALEKLRYYQQPPSNSGATASRTIPARSDNPRPSNPGLGNKTPAAGTNPDLVMGNLVPKEWLKFQWIVAVVVLFILIPIVAWIAISAFEDNQRRVNETERYVCEQLKKAGRSLPPNCDQFNLP
jgi:tetratricopeptide (TPR) repeat protein